MKNIRKQLLIGVAALSFGAGTLAAHAADTDATNAAAAKPAAHAKREHMREHMKDRMAKREKALHDKLKLTPEQEPAWSKFTEAMKPGTPPARADRAKMASMTAPERMDAMVERMKEGQTRMEARAAAVKEFYGVLTPDQQKVFDKAFAKMHRPHRPMKKHHKPEEKQN